MKYESKIVKAISETMSCDKCPYPCKKNMQSSHANCVMHWTKILSQIDTTVDWKEVRVEVGFSVIKGDDE